MELHVVQEGDTLQSIADYYKVSSERLIQDNRITNPNNLVIGQSIVIANPKLVYTIKEGDTLVDIANYYNISLIQLLANNPYLADSKFIYPGNEITILYDKEDKEKITIHGNTTPYINRNTLIKTLPYLTYLSVLNYTATKEGSIKVYYDDSDIIQLAKAYKVVPLMLLTTLTIQGEADIRTDFDLLLNEDFQNRQIDNILNILETKGYMGINISLQYLSVSNIRLYESYLSKVSKHLNAEGYQVFVTINPNLSEVNNQIAFEKIDYSFINQIAQNIIFMSYEWAFNPNPPSPISSAKNIESFLNYVLQYIPSQKVIIGIATIGYDWELPYVPGISNIRPISYDRFVEYASSYGAAIKFDSASQTPYFTFRNDENIEHSVWFIDARSIYSTLQLVSKYNLKGISIWNITIYNPQLWLIINSQYEIEKVI